MRSVVLGMVVFFGACNPAYAFRLVNAQFEAGKLYNYRDPLEPKYTLLHEGHEAGHDTNEAWNHQIGLDVDTNILETSVGYVYLDQNVVGQSTTKQYRRVYYEFEGGVSTALQQVQIFWHHKSEHMLDQEVNKYPLKDVYGFRVCLMGECKR